MSDWKTKALTTAAYIVADRNSAIHFFDKLDLALLILGRTGDEYAGELQRVAVEFWKWHAQHRDLMTWGEGLNKAVWFAIDQGRLPWENTN